MPARVSSPVLVARSDVLATVSAVFAASASGEPRFVVVRGEAGIGKTRLVREATSRLSDETRVLTGECLDIGAAGLPYLPIAEALRGLARSADAATLDHVLGSGRRDLATLVPELAQEGLPGEVAATEAAGSITSGLAQARLFERVLGVLRALSALGPTVLVVEDVHWIDRATRDLLTFLSRNLTDEHLAIVLTIRDDDLPRGHPILAWLAEIERSATTVVVEPGRLDRAAVARQLRQIAGGDLSAEVAELIWRRSDGNPLFVEELYAAGSDASEPPRSAVEVLLARVARLDPAARTVVDAAAVAGRPVDDRLLAMVLGLAEEEIDEPLRDAMANGVLELEPATDRYRFRHELLRETVERSLLPGARRRLHERFARCLEERPELADTSPVGAAGELAVHFAEAGLADEAYAHSLAAAGAAEAVHAYADAHRHLERALDLEGRLPAANADGAARLALRSRAADDADLAGEFTRALDLTRAALALVDAAADPAEAALLHSRIGYLLWSLGDGAAALAEHEEAARLVPDDRDTPERAKVLGSLGGALMGEGRWAESRAVCEAAIACAVAAGAAAEESRARNMLGSDLVALGDVDAGIAELRAACRIAGQAGRADMLIVGHHNLALNLGAADQLEDAVVEARAGLAVAREAGLERRFGQDLAAIAGDGLARLGRIDEADRMVAEALALDPGGEGTVYLSTVRARLAAIRGDFAEAARRRAAIDLASLDPDVAAYVAAVAAEALAWSGRSDEAATEAEAGLGKLAELDDVLWSAPLVALGLRGLADLAEEPRAARDAGSLDVARVDRLGARADWLAERVATTSGRGWVALARGEVARARGETGTDSWRAAIEAFDAVPDPLQAAYARLRAAEAELRARGLRADVAILLGDAAHTAERTGARPLAAAVAMLAGRARIVTTPRPVEPGTPGSPVDPSAGPVGQTATGTAAGPGGLVARGKAAGPDGPVAAGNDPRAAAMALGLSAREVEVLELVTAGMTNGEIAERLFITRKTAAVHVTHILDKLGVANRVSAAMIGARVGLGAADPNLTGPE